MLNVIFNDNAIDGLKKMDAGSVNTCITSPPYYGLRDYGVDGQIGLEETPDDYIQKLVDVFREVRRVLRDDGTLWVNIGDSYAGSGKCAWDRTGRQKEIYVPVPGGKDASMIKTPGGCKTKDLIGIPWMLAFALRADGWYLRQDIIWSKPNPMPESVTDRCTRSHEYIFLLSKSAHYYYDASAIAEDAIYKPGGSHSDVKQGGFNDKGVIPGSGQRSFRAIRQTRNKRSVWTVSTKGFKGAHFAVYPEELITPCVLAGCIAGGVVLDPFMGSGTTAVVAIENNRNYVGCEINPAYVKITENRVKKAGYQTRL